LTIRNPDQPLASNAILQLFIFGVVGVLATATHYVVALVCTEAMGISVYISNLFGYLVALPPPFFGYGTFTFRVRLSPQIFTRFCIASALTFLFSECLLGILATQYQMGHRLNLLLVVILIPMVTFVINKFWVYAVTQD